jgi:N6-adenosine-specific RNA methylase IME4
MTLDPPWLERGGGQCKRGADRHYGLLSTPDIAKTVLRAPVWTPADDAHLWMWVTDNFLLDGLGLIERFGFRYVRMFHWIKTLSEQDPVDESELQQGLGQYARGSSETCLFAVRGRAIVPPSEKRPKNVIFAPRGRHSEKPNKAFTYWFEQVSPGPRLEMFSRAPRDGWSVWGNECQLPAMPAQP